MSPRPLLIGLRGLVLLGAFGLAAELVLASHMESWVQRIPFGLCFLGILGAIAASPEASPSRLKLAKGLFGLMFAGGLYGIWEHVEHNYVFDAEIRPTAEWTTHVWNAIFGASPALAPGAFLLVALMGLLLCVRQD